VFQDLLWDATTSILHSKSYCLGIDLDSISTVELVITENLVCMPTPSAAGTIEATLKQQGNTTVF
jgi:hypothetical protein